MARSAFCGKLTTTFSTAVPLSDPSSQFNGLCEVTLESEFAMLEKLAGLWYISAAYSTIRNDLRSWMKSRIISFTTWKRHCYMDRRGLALKSSERMSESYLWYLRNSMNKCKEEGANGWKVEGSGTPTMKIDIEMSLIAIRGLELILYRCSSEQYRTLNP